MMHDIDTIYIDGAFVTPRGNELMELRNPATAEIFGRVLLANAEDAHLAIAAAKRAFPAWSQSTVADRLAVLERLHAALAARRDELLDAIVEEYGAPLATSGWMADFAVSAFPEVAGTLKNFDFTRQISALSTVTMTPLGVAGLITPWNSNASFICSKFATAIAAGCTAVIKPSELCALSTRIVTEAIHSARLPAGVVNIVTGRGEVVGPAITAHRDVAKISFTGSTAVGKSIQREAVDTMKRVTLEMGGKSPTVILDDADLHQAAFMALHAGFMNNGQACIAGTRILVPAALQKQFVAIATQLLENFKPGDPREPSTALGPLINQKQWNRVQGYIEAGIDEGATLAAGGAGLPDGLANGYFVRPTLFADVRNDMRIARDEIFGPVLSIIPYEGDEEAIRIANDTDYGLIAYVLSSNAERARGVAARIMAGRVLVNTLSHDPNAPFGGFKQSGIGREYGTYGLEAFLEPKAILEEKGPPRNV